MKKSDKKRKAFARFRAKNGTPHLLVPEFDVKHVDHGTLESVAKILGAEADRESGLPDGRLHLTKAEGEIAPVAYALDEEAAALLRKAGARYVGLRAFPVPDRRENEEDRRTESLMALRRELGLPERRVSRDRREPEPKSRRTQQSGPWPYFG